MQEERAIPETGAPAKPTGIDYVTLVATVVLGGVSIADLIYGDGSVALVAAGAVAGYVTRLYR